MNTRMYNDQLVHIASGCEEMYLEPEGPRQSGKTYRSVLRALLWASANPNKLVLYAVHSHDECVHAFRMAGDMTSHLERRMRTDSRSIDLPNGSRIEFRSSRDTGYEVGRKYTHMVRDA